MLRQSLRYCLKQEKWAGEHNSGMRAMLPKMLDQHGLLDREPGDKRAEDSWIEELSRTIFQSSSC